MRRFGIGLLLMAVLAAACGDSDDDTAATTTAAATETSEAAATTTEAATTTAAADTTEAPTTTEAAATTTEAAETTEAPEASGAAVEVELLEWSVEAPSELQAGSIEFSVTNGGEFPHEFVIIRGDGYASLPTNALGTVQEDELEDGQLITRIDRFDAGTTQTVTVDLEPGNYVILCNIEFGPNSHAGNGQTLDVTVTG